MKLEASKVRNTLLAILAAMSPALALACAGTDTPTEENRAIDAIVNQAGEAFVSNPHHVGLSIGIVQDGIEHTYGFGTTDRATLHVPDERTLYEIGSATKSYTGILLAQAVLDGKIKLADPVQKYLASPYPNLGFAGRPVTILDLANHTAGLPKHIRPFRDGMSVQQMLDSYGDYSEAQFLEDLKKIAITERPGTHFRYSNIDSQLIGIILEQQYGKSYEELVRQFITAPNGMRDTSVAVDRALRDRIAQGYDGLGNPMPELRFWKAIPAAGSLKSTVHDQLSYLQWNLDAGNPAVALSHQVTFAHTDERDDDIALYWFVKQFADGTLVIRHTGGSFGTTSYLAFYPKAGLGMVFLANDADSSTERELVKMGEGMADQLIHPAGAKAGTGSSE